MNVETYTEIEHFLRDREQRLLNRIKDRPYIYLSMTPANLDGGRGIIDITDSTVVDLLRNPPNYREGGWGIYRTEPRSTPDGLVSEFDVSILRDTQRLELLRNGHLELSIKIDQRRFDIEHVRRNGQEHPVLYVYPMCEIPLNFLRLGSEIGQKCKAGGAVIIKMGLYNVRGYSLCVHGRNTEGYKRQWTDGNFPSCREDHVVLPLIQTPAGFEPGRLAKRLSEGLWSAFGFRESPPLFDEQGNFRP